MILTFALISVSETVFLLVGCTETWCSQAVTFSPETSGSLIVVAGSCWEIFCPPYFPERQDFAPVEHILDAHNKLNLSDCSVQNRWVT
jgi:hypothetical protein